MNELNLIKAKQQSIAQVLIIPMVEDLEKPIRLATNLRNLGIETEIYLNNKKLKAKFKYADKLKIPYVIVVGEDEISTNTVNIKNMGTGEEEKAELNAEKILDKLI